MTRPAFTVAVCTRDRAALLGRLLGVVQAQAAGVRGPWSLLVVDNGSRDATREVAGAFVGRLPLTVLYEPRAGLSVARNRALASAEAPLLVFTDDDVFPAPGWLEAWETVATGPSEHGWFGGRVTPRWPGAKPRWLVDDSIAFLDGVLVRHAPHGATRPYGPSDPLPIGGSFGLRTTLRETVGLFREDLGHKGEERGLGEETDWLRRARALGHAGLYVHDAWVEHPVDVARLRLRSLWRHGVASGVAHARMHPDAPAGGGLRAAWALARGARQSLLGRGDRFRQCVVNAGIEMGLRRERRRRARGASSSLPPGTRA